MSKQVLRVKYHPAMKEINFQRLQEGMDIPIPKVSDLRGKYMNKRGEFILQHQGPDFLLDISKIFRGERIANLEVVTTKIDYADFEKMVEDHNDSNPDTRIESKLWAELPNMDETYRAVKEHGERSIGILGKHQSKFHDIPMDNKEVKKYIDDFTDEVQKEIDNIKEKIKDMEENNVYLCFVGVFSTGKSALINAILGYPILPVALEAKTARMFRIQSPKAGENVRVVFQIITVHTELVWNDSAGVFEFSAGPNDSPTRKSIQDVINQNKEKQQYMQIQKILDTLNTDNDIKDIRVYFPIPLDNDKIQFTIYDTPGTDSNDRGHKMVLQETLKKQSHSILVFVAAPLKVEGEGNNALLNHIIEAEKKDSKTCIDLGHSLFVMNWVDSIDSKDRKNLQNAKIENRDDDDFSIKLSDKKLFFTSAKVAYVAKAKKNGIPLTDDDDDFFDGKKRKISDIKSGRYYQYNLCATSDSEKNRVINEANSALEEAEKNGDTLEVMHICSGVYSLEKEIVLYGEKYAAAVKAFAIIDSVDTALSNLNKSVRKLEKQSEDELRKINEEVSSQRQVIWDSIQEEYSKLEIPEGPLPPVIAQKLHLDRDYLDNAVVRKAYKFIVRLIVSKYFGLSRGFLPKEIRKTNILSDLLKNVNLDQGDLTDLIAFFDKLKERGDKFIDSRTENLAKLIGEVKFSEAHKREIIQEVTAIVDDFKSDFLEKRQTLLEEERDKFIEKIKGIIHNNGEISDDAKDIILDIPKPEIETPNIARFDKIYDSNTRSVKGLLSTYTYDKLDIPEYLKAVKKNLPGIAEALEFEFKLDYRKSLTKILDAVKEEFIQNLDKYSNIINMKRKAGKTMDLLHEKIINAAAELEDCQEELEKKIWKEKIIDQ